MRAVAGKATDIGKVRDHNEDGFLVADPLFAVADGMGGHLGGEVASSVALDTLRRCWPERSLADALREANRAVYGRALRDMSVAGMGTTMTAVVLDGDELQLAHVGDSRAYLVHDGRMIALTDDHTLVGEMVRAGEITEQQARVHPRRSILTRAIGIEPDVTVDEETFPISPGDRLLLCSDGLSSGVSDETILHWLDAKGDPQEAADALVVAANDGGGYDNVTVVVIDFAPDPAEDPEVVEAEVSETDGGEDAARAPDDGPEGAGAAQATADAPGGAAEGPEGPEAPADTPSDRHGFLGRLFRRR